MPLGNGLKPDVCVLGGIAGATRSLDGRGGGRRAQLGRLLCELGSFLLALYCALVDRVDSLNVETRKPRSMQLTVSLMLSQCPRAEGLDSLLGEVALLLWREVIPEGKEMVLASSLVLVTERTDVNEAWR